MAGLHDAQLDAAIHPFRWSAGGGLDPDALTPEEFGVLLAAAGMGGAGLPEINAMLATARPALRERLLQEFLGLLHRPP